MAALDPITTEVIHNYFLSAARGDGTKSHADLLHDHRLRDS